MEDIFEDLHTIPWSDLQHAYGDAGDIPRLLKALVEKDDDTRQSALYDLFGKVCHQGTVYEATSYVVPYLVKILKSVETPDREAVAGLLGAIANGSGYLEVHAGPDSIFADIWDEFLSKKEKDLEEQMAEEYRWVVAVRKAVDPHLDILYEFIQHEAWDICFEIASALGKYPSHAQDSLSVLRAALEQETDEDIRGMLLLSISKLEGYGDE